MKRFAPLVLVAALGGCGGGAHVRLTVSPRDGLLDAPLSVHASGLHGNATLAVSATDADGREWLAREPYKPGNAGLLLASMLPEHRRVERDRAYFLAPPREVVHFTLSKSRHTVASTDVVRRLFDPHVKERRETLARQGFVGRFCVGPRRRGPGILMLGGSEGGLPGCRVIASHGYPTLALAYFGEPGLPHELVRIPLEYFARALRWLARQPGLNPKKVVVMGTSRGGEAALLIASTYPKLVHGAIGLVPSAYVNGGFSRSEGVAVDAPAWTLHGKAVPYLQQKSVAPAKAAIPVERISGPVFVVGAGDDQLWPSAIYVDDIASRMHDHGRHDVVALTYPHAGHAGFGLPTLPTPTVVQSPYGAVYLGGTPAADARARADSSPKLLRFLAKLSS